MKAFREGRLPDRFGVRPTHTLRTFIMWLHSMPVNIAKVCRHDATGKHVYRRDMEMSGLIE